MLTFLLGFVCKGVQLVPFAMDLITIIRKNKSGNNQLTYFRIKPFRHMYVFFCNLFCAKFHTNWKWNTIASDVDNSFASDKSQLSLCEFSVMANN